MAGLEEEFLRQKCKLHWLHVGDKNTKAFYNALKERHLINAIHEVIDPQGTSLTNQEDIKVEAVRLFSDLLSSRPSDFTGLSVDDLKGILHYRCSLRDQELLVAEITETEVKKVFFSMPLNKSPGPDGFTVEFFRESWLVIGQEVTMAISSFFSYGFLPKGLNSTILALIPKRTDSKEMKDYRPISCCNVLY